MVYEYFRVSMFVQDKDMLSGWFDHFVNREIPCCIVRHSNNRFSLWRTGAENASGGDKPNEEPLEGEIVQSYEWNISTGTTG
jgi:hypothetical protein